VNVSFYSNPEVNRLFRDADAEPETARRVDIYRRIEHRIVEDAPWIFLVQFNSKMLCQPWLKGVRATGFWPAARLENCWLER
jgi:ABC-type transport system substrate-binding protein